MSTMTHDPETPVSDLAAVPIAWLPRLFGASAASIEIWIADAVQFPHPITEEPAVEWGTAYAAWRANH